MIAKIVEMVRAPLPADRSEPSSASDVNLDQLPVPILRTLIGRDGERAELREALVDPDVAIAVPWGFGGTGKTSVVDTFLTDVAPGYGGARKVFAWHFYSQDGARCHIVACSSWTRRCSAVGSSPSSNASNISLLRNRSCWSMAS